MNGGHDLGGMHGFGPIEIELTSGTFASLIASTVARSIATIGRIVNSTLRASGVVTAIAVTVAGSGDGDVGSMAPHNYIADSSVQTAMSMSGR